MTVLRALALTVCAWGLAFGATWMLVVMMGEGVR
jgi:hypothetical protein